MKTIIIELITLALMALALFSVMSCSGCVNKVYDRTTLTVDPNGLMRFERVHGGITGIATDTEFDSFEVESGSRRVKVVKAKENQDNIKVIIPTVGVIETKE